MQKSESKPTVFFENPFWVGIYERIFEGKLEVCKITFGAEPKDYAIYAFLLENWNKLRFSSPVKAGHTDEGRRNPKRMQRDIKKQLSAQGIGTGRYLQLIAILPNRHTEMYRRHGEVCRLL